MYSAASGFPPWHANGTMNQHNSHPAYIPVPTRNAYTAQPGLPPPPTYVPQPLSQHTGLHHQSPAPSSTAHVPTTAAVASQQGRKKTEWPPAVRDYVSRCFAPENQIDSVARQEMESRLKQVITNAATNDQLHALDWTRMPLPQNMILHERSRAALASQIPSSSFVLQAHLPSTTNNSHHSSLNAMKKRKSSELHNEKDDVPQHPWHNQKSTGSLADRVTFPPNPDKRPKLDVGKPVSKSSANLEQRRRRFEDNRDGSKSPKKVAHHSQTTQPESTGPVIGRSQKLEKNYFRLTSAPNPDDVRPLEVLKKTLEYLKKKWRSESNYVYICDQFKSLRQDLTVQHIKNEFTTDVYEIHARIALEKGDLGEYNQCQTQLRALYRQNLGGNPREFMAYRILYLLHTCNRTDMNDVLSDLTIADKSNQAVQHALQVRSALALGNYHKFFQLYLTVPNMGGYLMDKFVPRERLAALARICRTYKPDVKLRFLTEELAFEHDKEAATFLRENNADLLLTDKNDTFYFSTGKAGQLFEEARQAAFQQVDIKGQI